MSWSLSVPATSVEDFDSAIEDVRAAYDASVVSQFQDDQVEPTREQITEAIAAVSGIVDSGAVGKQVTVSMYGHANAGHEPADGWANETVTITVSFAP